LEYVGQIGSDFTGLRSDLVSLQQTIDSLIDSPSPSALLEARISWSAAHQSYHQSNLPHYFTSFIAPANQTEQLYQLAYQMDHWPILAGYIDSVGGYESGGIVHDVNVELSTESLRQQHGLFDITEATLGFHVIEFLLWGEPNIDSTRRELEDFVRVNQLTDTQSESGMEINQVGNNRRRELLRLTSAILIEDFDSGFAIWTDASSGFLGAVEDRSSATILNLLLESVTAMITEELLTRSLYPLLNGDIESALQSPYSQTSEITVAAQIQSVEQLLLETPTPNGITLDKILSSLSPSFEEFFYQNLDSNKACLILLYSSFGQTDKPMENHTIEFEVVECINLLTNFLDQLEQIKLTLPALSEPV
jgi:putative iron-regulated protein